MHGGGAIADPKEAGESGETNRRHAVSLARLLRAGELTSVQGHEAMRDLVPRERRG